jgi:hypothetical protein
MGRGYQGRRRLERGRDRVRWARGVAVAVAVGVAAATSIAGAGTAFADTGPFVRALSVTSGTPGTVVAVSGIGFLDGCSGTLPQVVFGVETPDVINATDTTVRFQVPVVRDGLYDVQVVDCLGEASPPVQADEFTVTLPPRPKVTSVAPKTGSVGTTVTLLGTNLRLYCTDGRLPSVTFDNPDVFDDEVVLHDGDPSIVSWSDTKIVLHAPTHATGLVDILPSDCVGRQSIPVTTDQYTYLPPKISSVTPATGTAGTRLTVKGANFTGGCGEGTAPTLIVGGIALTAGSPGVISMSAIQIVALAPPHLAGVVAVQVRNCVGDVSAVVTASRFTYLAPKITSMLPTSGKAGTLVTVNGSGFTNGCVAGTSAPVVQFGATTLVPGDARYVSATNVAVKVRVPVSPIGKVDVRVSDCLGDTTAIVAADKFTVTG